MPNCIICKIRQSDYVNQNPYCEICQPTMRFDLPTKMCRTCLLNPGILFDLQTGRNFPYCSLSCVASELSLLETQIGMLLCAVPGCGSVPCLDSIACGIVHLNECKNRAIIKTRFVLLVREKTLWDTFVSWVNSFFNDL